MLRLRLARSGRRNQPKYRLVVAEHKEKLNGGVVATVGHYLPTAKDKPLVIDKEAITYWVSMGMKPSNTVARLLNAEGFNFPVEQRPARAPKKAAKAEPDKAPAAAASAPVEGEVAPAESGAAQEETNPEEATSPSASSGSNDQEPLATSEAQDDAAPAVEEVAAEAPAEQSETQATPAATPGEPVDSKGDSEVDGDAANAA